MTIKEMLEISLALEVARKEIEAAFDKAEEKIRKIANKETESILLPFQLK